MPPLSNLCVIDLSRNVAGPLATMLLGDMGAGVVKIERPPRGDEARYHGPPFVGQENPYFLSHIDVNRPSLFGLSLDGDRAFYWFALVCLGIVMIGVDRMRRGRLGRKLAAMRDSETGAESIGLDLSSGIEYRPLLNNNVIILAGASAFCPSNGFRQLYNRFRSDRTTLGAAFVEVTLTY